MINFGQSGGSAFGTTSKKPRRWWDKSGLGDQFTPEPPTPVDPNVYQDQQIPADIGKGEFPWKMIGGDPFAPPKKQYPPETDTGPAAGPIGPTGFEDIGGGGGNYQVGRGHWDGSMWVPDQPRNWLDDPRGGRPPYDKTGWKFDPITGKPIGGEIPIKPGVPPPVVPGAGTDFWAQMYNAMNDPNDPIDQEGWQMLIDTFATDPKWKAPTSAAAKRLLSQITAFKKMGYDNDQLAPLINKAFEMGYSKPKWSLSLFDRMLSGYGLGTAAPAAGG